MKIISWNINGLRAIQKKGFIEWLYKEKPDIIGLQEIKAKADQLPQELITPDGYYGYINSAARPGYSGTAIYSKAKPKNISYGFTPHCGAKFDSEGRILSADFGDFIFLNIYFPNGKSGHIRLKYKLDFYDAALAYFDSLVEKGEHLIITGDVNTAHSPIDLARPKENEDISGFLPIEREWMDKLVAHGFVDCFREFNPEPNNYTWWSQRSGARQRNVGWRIDYFFVSKNFRPHIKNCYHLTDVMGSDHCPIVLELK